MQARTWARHKGLKTHIISLSTSITHLFLNTSYSQSKANTLQAWICRQKSPHAGLTAAFGSRIQLDWKKLTRRRRYRNGCPADEGALRKGKRVFTTHTSQIHNMHATWPNYHSQLSTTLIATTDRTWPVRVCVKFTVLCAATLDTDIAEILRVLFILQTTLYCNTQASWGSSAGPTNPSESSEVIF